MIVQVELLFEPSIEMLVGSLPKLVGHAIFTLPTTFDAVKSTDHQHERFTFGLLFAAPHHILLVTEAESTPSIGPTIRYDESYKLDAKHGVVPKTHKLGPVEMVRISTSLIVGYCAPASNTIRTYR